MKKNGHDVSLRTINVTIKSILMIKLVAIFLFALTLQSFGRGYGQGHIKLTLKNVQLKQALRALEDQGNFRFVYKDEILPKGSTVSINVENASVQQVLNKMLENTSLSYKLLNEKLIVITRTNSEYNSAAVFEKTVNGKVVNEQGAPLAGVTVLEQGTTNGTSTKTDGTFSLAVSNDNASLEISFVGYASQTVALKGQSNISVSLVTATNKMDEVVVVGYGTQRRSTITGAVSSVKASDLENMPISRVEQALQGRSSGLTIAASSGQPGSGSTVRVRGTTSINNSDPLYVVDGLPVDGGIDNINQSDIESIEVLKDAASAAIYGARSASGVILITTKKGRAGSMQLNYSGYYGTQAPARKLKLLNAEQYATLRNESSVASGGAILFNDPASLGKGTDWQNIIFNNSAKIQNHELSISGGGDRSTYYSSFGYYDQEGIVATDISKYKRFSVRFNSNHKVKNWLNFGNNLAYTYIKSQGIGNTNNEFGGILSSAINLDPITPAIVTDPAMQNAYPSNDATRPYIRDASGNPYGVSQYVQNEMSNPLAYIQTHLGNNSWSHNVIGNVFMEAEPIKGLKLRSTVGTKLAFYGSDNYNPFYFFNPTNLNNARRSFSRSINQSLNWSWENTASYTKSFGFHNLTALVGTGAYVEGISEGQNSNYDSLPANINTYKDAASMNYSVISKSTTSSGYTGTEHRVSSLFGRLLYNYNEKYLFTAILRRDGSSRFGSNNKYGYFPSASLGWVASREDFWNFRNVVSFFKVRASYGVTGNDNIGNFQYISTVGGGRNYTFGSDNYIIGFSPNAPSNPDLKWEQTSQLDIGFDASLFRNFSLTFDIYNKKTTGMLRPIILPGYVGTNGNPTGNVASMTNKGFEVELGYQKQLGQVNFSLKGNTSYLQNKITNMGTVLYTTGASFQSSAYELSRLQVGQSIGAFYGFQTMGIFQNQAEVDAYTAKSGQKIQPNAAPGDFRYADLNGDGQINTDDRTFIGDPTPTWSFGFTANAAYKNFDIVLFGQGVAGNDIFNGLRRLDLPAANWTTSALERWTGEGTSNNFPRLIQSDPNKNFSNPSSFYLQPGDYFRIKTLQVGYSLPKSLISRAGFSRVRVYVSANNLATFTKYEGFDPEIGGGSFGIDRGYYPQARSYMVGLNVGL
jgi:TonB-linked SusC/RagA family outer membrane protein